MTYKNFIDSIKESRENKYFKYSERHHIIPRCLGGTDDEENLIYLTYQEHFTAHKLLHEENPEEPKLIYALWRMSNRVEDISPEDYETARLRYTELMRGDMNPSRRKEVKAKLRGRSPMLGKHHTEETKRYMSIRHSQISEETREKMRKSHTGLKHTPESIEKMKNREYKEEWRENLKKSLKGKPKSSEHRESLSKVPRTEEWCRKISEAKKGIPMSEENKRKISEACKGRIVTPEEIEKRRPAMIEAFKNRVYNHVCLICGESFTSKSSRSKYCLKCKEKKGF